MFIIKDKSHNAKKRTFRHTCPNEDPSHPAQPRSLIRVFFVHMKRLHLRLSKKAPSEDSDQTVQMCRLICIFAGRTCAKVRFLTAQNVASC